MRILAVDDDPTIIEMLHDCLTEADGFDLVSARTAEEATDLVANSGVSFDCFLLDIMLPGIDGIELCRQIRADPVHQTTPIIMITGSRKYDLMERAFQAGATDFISKPLNGMELGARINTAGLLNDSLRRERQVRHTLAELTELMQARFEDSLDLRIAGVSDLNGLENQLLRLPDGCYAMNLFSITLPQARRVFDTFSHRAFRTALAGVAKASVAALQTRRAVLGYGGGGVFVGAVIARQRFDPDQLEREINTLMTDIEFEDDEHGTGVSVGLLSKQRLWSGPSACQALRASLVEPQPDVSEQSAYVLQAAMRR